MNEVGGQIAASCVSFHVPTQAWLQMIESLISLYMSNSLKNNENHNVLTHKQGGSVVQHSRTGLSNRSTACFLWGRNQTSKQIYKGWLKSFSTVDIVPLQEKLFERCVYKDIYFSLQTSEVAGYVIDFPVRCMLQYCCRCFSGRFMLQNITSIWCQIYEWVGLYLHAPIFLHDVHMVNFTFTCFKSQSGNRLILQWVSADFSSFSMQMIII